MLIVRDKVTTLQAAIRNITFLKCQQKVKPLTMENTVGKTCGTMPVSDGSFTIQFRVELSLLSFIALIVNQWQRFRLGTGLLAPAISQSCSIQSTTRRGFLPRWYP